MDFIKEWITNIIIFILLATVLDMLLPNSSFQKYTKIVTGLILIAIILSPVMKLFTSDFESAIASMGQFNSLEDENIKNSIEFQKKEIQASQHAYILETMAVQLKTAAEEELMEQQGMEIANIELEVNDQDQRPFPENLEYVIVHVKKAEDEGETVAVVREVEIDTKAPLPSKQTSQNTDQISSLLSEKWNVPEKSIQIMIEGGSDEHGQ
ncbi:stage III sporulation protein AF [Mesobacillus selenatarsenatis]|uniref:Stage III sporulation protein AF n=1 Tax=Mesobacillus selenatarsenatis (strain DSM 18680 / JCM 14380 / FERM P-15431 / SF-1) TaxID=1321606 RepID=A0A0A8X605_MESS1|nr:stage III sporulation protein AF [Mesobacillus selenatarsenatis]GAM15353.1 stage III sporulation protein AF [Mesobacillus selenatarsenatis SF-1]